MDAFGLYRNVAYYFSIILLLSTVYIDARRFSTVLITRKGNIIGSGSLKDSKTVITAASLVKDGDVSQYGVLFNKEQEFIAVVVEKTVHANYDGNLNDIAKLTLRDNAWYDGRFLQVHAGLPTKVYDTGIMFSDDDDNCRIIDMFGEEVHRVDILSHLVCSRQLKTSVDEKQLCVQLKGSSKGSCPSGAGNPVVCKVQFGVWRQVGIHIDRDCTSDLMVATRLATFRTWMRKPEKREESESSSSDEDDDLSEISGEPSEISEIDEIVDIEDIGETAESENTDETDESGNVEEIDETEETDKTGEIGVTGEPGDTDETGESGDTGETVESEDADEAGETGNTTISSTEVDVEEVIRPCNETEFTCSDGTCIPDVEVCDGSPNCPSGPDDENSCGCDLAGTEFVTGFLNSIGPAVAILYITAPEGANVTVTIPELDYNETREIEDVEKWYFDNTTLIITELLSNKGVHVSSDRPITLVAVNSREVSYTTIDGTIVYPLNCLTNAYTVELHHHNFYKASQFAVIAVEPNTTTDIKTRNKKGVVKTATLGYLEVYFMQGRDFRALTVEASEKVAVLSGSECGYVPFYKKSCDHMVNQIPPKTNLGEKYIVSPQEPRAGYMYRVRAVEDGTHIEIREQNSSISETAILNKNTEFIRFVYDSSSYSIVSYPKVMVTQYALSALIDDLGQGDPSMIVLQSLGQFDSAYKFIVPDHFLRIGLTIYISTGYDVSGLRLNDEELARADISTVTISAEEAYNVINVDVSSKWEEAQYATLSHLNEHASFGAMMYGMRVEGAFAWRIGGKI